MHRIENAALLFLIAASAAGQDKILWRDPGAVERIAFTAPAGGPVNPPRPPFYFVSEGSNGTNPKVLVRDGASVLWRVKGGQEVKAENFATRLVGALGYYAEPTSFLNQGKIHGLKPLKRASSLVRPDGSFGSAALERQDPQLKYLEQDWAWNYNPFLGTRELQGLKILVMLLSNWDNKDARNRRIGSNTSIVEQRVNDRIQLTYFVNDWGQTLGAWGSEMKSKSWDCVSFSAQTRSFVEGRTGDKVRFGFTGIHTDDFKADITVEDVRWLLRYLGRVTDAQIRDALTASGASADEKACFAAALRSRIEQLSRVSAQPTRVTRR
jgi:hypothetical protein